MGSKTSFVIPHHKRRTLFGYLQRTLWHLARGMSDKACVSLQYYSTFGRWPDFEKPNRFSEKVQVRKLYDRNPLYPILSDKAAVKDYIMEKQGPSYIIPTYWLGKNLQEVHWERIPLPAVVKPTHASAKGRFIFGEEDIEHLLDNDPSESWIGLNHFDVGREWAYSQIEGQIIIEKMLLIDQEIPWDYRFYVFDGKVKLVEIDMRLDGLAYHCYYSPDWNRLSVSSEDEQSRAYPYDVPRPARYEEMCQLAESLVEEIDFARVDLYTNDEWIHVGEITLYPAAGYEVFDPGDFDVQLGSFWNQRLY